MSTLKRSGVWLLVLLLLPLASDQALGQAAESETVEAGPAAGSCCDIDPPQDAVWSVALDLQRFVNHPLGQKVLDMVDQVIRSEVAGDADTPTDLNLATLRAKIAPVIGFDPIDGIVRIMAYGPFPGEIRNEHELVEKTARDSVVMVWLKETTGNLEGLALATRDYQSVEYNGATIHSGLLPEVPVRIHMAISQPQADKATKLAVFALQEDQLKQALDRLGHAPAGAASPSDSGGGDRVPGAMFTASVRLDDDTIRALHIPEQQSAVVKMLQRLSLSVGAEEDTVIVQASVEVVDEQRADQVRQLLEGAIAFVQLPIEELEEEEEFLLLREALTGVEVSRSGNRVICRLRTPLERVMSAYPALIEAID